MNVSDRLPLVYEICQSLAKENIGELKKLLVAHTTNNLKKIFEYDLNPNSFSQFLDTLSPEELCKLTAKYFVFMKCQESEI
jgi:hypothetical protein